MHPLLCTPDEIPTWAQAGPRAQAWAGCWGILYYPILYYIILCYPIWAHVTLYYLINGYFKHVLHAFRMMVSS